MDDIKVNMMMPCALKGQRPSGKVKPPGSRYFEVSLVKCPSFFLVQASGFPFPLVGSQHPSVGISTPWRSDLIIPPYVSVYRENSCSKTK
jgi:hypothetical protein